MVESPLITVVVCTRNRAESLRTALESLTRLQPPDCDSRSPMAGPFHEVLVVDNGSTDATPDVVNEVAASAPVPIRHVVESRKGVVPARNRGIREARGEWVAFFDDDQFADPIWLRELYTLALEQRARCVGGAVHLKLPDGVNRRLSPVVRMLLGETAVPDVRRYTDRFTPGAGNLMIHHSVFDQVGTFDERCADRGEDTDLFLRILRAGIGGWYSPGAIVQHVIPAARLESEFLLRHAARMSRGMAENERNARGAGRYPLVWIARVAQLVVSLLPRLAWAATRGDREGLLGMRCRVRIAWNVIRDGARLLRRTGFRPLASSAPIAGPTGSLCSSSQFMPDRLEACPTERLP